MKFYAYNSLEQFWNSRNHFQNASNSDRIEYEDYKSE